MALSHSACLFVIEETDLSGFDRRERHYIRIDVTESIEEFNVIGGPVFAYQGLPEHTQEPEMNNIDKNIVSQNYLNILNDVFFKSWGRI